MEWVAKRVANPFGVHSPLVYIRRPLSGQDSFFSNGSLVSRHKSHTAGLNPALLSSIPQSPCFTSQRLDPLVPFTLGFPFERDTDEHLQFLQREAPHRLPASNRVYESSVRTALRRQRLHADPVAAIAMLQEIHHSDIIHLRFAEIEGRAAMPQSLDDDFSCIIAPQHALEAAILHGPVRGLFLDTSHKNKNSLKAPLTMVSTLGDTHRMTPVAANVHTRIRGEDYTAFLRVLKEAIVKLAKAIANGERKPICLPQFHEDLMNNCRAIVQEGFKPAMFMIDASGAERRAILTVFPGCCIRVCQFHLMQSCRAVLRGHFGPTPISDTHTETALRLIRRLQRCPYRSQWDQYWKDFENDMRGVVGGGRQGEAFWEFISSYLLRTWFSDHWRDHAVDYGMPGHITRDGPWSTNNYAEALFKTFDAVFLLCRMNKPIDRLIMVLLQIYFPFYRHNWLERSRPDPKLVRQLFAGFNAWEADRVLRLDQNEVPLAYRGRANPVFSIAGDTGKEIQYCGWWIASEAPLQGANGNSECDARQFCSCTAFEQTGKRCEHLWAMAAFETANDITTYEQKSFNSSAKIQRYMRSLAGQAGKGTGDDSAFVSGAETKREIDEVLGNFDWTYTNAENGLLETDLDGSWSVGPIARRHQPSTQLLKPFATTEVPHKPVLAISDQAEDLAQSVSRGIGARASDHAEKGSGEASRVSGPAPHVISRTHKLPTHQKAQRSSLTPRPGKLTPQLPPTGFLNPSTDCFALCILGMWSRLAALDSLDSANRAKLLQTENPAGAVFPYILQAREAIQNGAAVTLMGLQERLMNADLIDDHSSNQHDPVEFLEKLVQHMDTLVGDHSYRLAFEHVSAVRFQCRACESHLPSQDCTSIHGISQTAYPANDSLFDRSVTGLVRHSIEGVHALPPLALACGSCGHHDLLKSVIAYSQLGDLFAIHPQYPMKAFETDEAQRSLSFTIEHEVDIPLFYSNSGATSNVRYSLSYVIVRSGVDTSAGHYCLILRHEGNWWRLSDHRATRLSGVQDAFRGPFLPIYLVYERAVPRIAVSSLSTVKPAEDKINPIVAAISNRNLQQAAMARTALSHPKGLSERVVPPPPSPSLMAGAAARSKRVKQRSQAVSRSLNKVSESPEVVLVKTNAPPLVEFDYAVLAVKLEEQHALEAEALVRYQKIVWADVRPLVSIVPVLPDVTFDLFAVGQSELERQRKSGNVIAGMTTFGRTFGMDTDDTMRYFSEQTRWWTNWLISDLCQSVDVAISASLRSPAWRGEHAMADLIDRPMGRLAIAQNRYPLEVLGPTAAWRKKVTFIPISAAPNLHFCTLAIFGEQRLLVFYDGKGGALDHPHLYSLWRDQLDRRLEWELQRCLVDEDTNRGWIICPNTSTWREAIGWFEQEDSYNCGPLAATAAVCLAQGLKPCRQNLDDSEQNRRLGLAPSEGVNLRRALWVHCMAVLWAEGRSSWSGEQERATLKECIFEVRQDIWRAC